MITTATKTAGTIHHATFQARTSSTAKNIIAHFAPGFFVVACFLTLACAVPNL
jgi:hypothetical protein